MLVVTRAPADLVPRPPPWLVVRRLRRRWHPRLLLLDPREPPQPFARLACQRPLLEEVELQALEKRHWPLREPVLEDDEEEVAEGDDDPPPFRPFAPDVDVQVGAHVAELEPWCPHPEEFAHRAPEERVEPRQLRLLVARHEQQAPVD